MLAALSHLRLLGHFHCLLTMTAHDKGGKGVGSVGREHVQGGGVCSVRVRQPGGGVNVAGGGSTGWGDTSSC